MQHHVPPLPLDDLAHAVEASPVVPWISSSPKARRLTSEELLAGGREVEIHHHGVIYRLKITSLGKLILTK